MGEQSGEVSRVDGLARTRETTMRLIKRDEVRGRFGSPGSKNSTSTEFRVPNEPRSQLDRAITSLGHGFQCVSKSSVLLYGEN